MKSLLNIVLGIICGNLTWISAAYAFGIGTSQLVFPLAKVFHYYIAFTIYTITDLIIISLISFVLTIIIGKEKKLFISYIFGMTCWPLFSTISSHIEMIQKRLPVWDTLISHLIVLLFIAPLFAWIGVTFGNRYRQHVQTNRHAAGRI